VGGYWKEAYNTDMRRLTTGITFWEMPR